MTITTYPGQFDLRRQECTQIGAGRTPGVHLSGVLEPICRRNGWLPEEDDISLTDLIATTNHTNAGDISNLVRLAVGQAWEQWISKHLPNMIHQPGEFELDGVIGTPDGIETHPVLTVHEFKATWKSKRRKIEQQWLWIYQAMGYVRMVEEKFQEPCTTAWLHVLWTMGSYTYKDGDGPKASDYRLDFAPGEVKAFWDMVVLPGRADAIPE